MVNSFIYELRPFVYMYGALSAAILNGSTVTDISAVLLVICSVKILHWRWISRRAPKETAPAFAPIPKK